MNFRLDFSAGECASGRIIDGAIHVTTFRYSGDAAVMTANEARAFASALNAIADALDRAFPTAE